MRKVKILIDLQDERLGGAGSYGHLISTIRAKFPQIDVTEKRSEIADADAVFSWLIKPAEIKKAKGLKWFHTAGVQYERLLPNGLYKKAKVTNSSGVWAGYITEQFFRLLGSFMDVSFLKGKTAGIIGLGGIGGEVARRAKALQMDIVATRLHPSKGRGFADRIMPPSKLGELLKVSDVIFVTVPLTSDTRRLFKKVQFERMKYGVYILSSSRPEVIDKQALAAAMDSGRVSGAVLDDMWPEEIRRMEGVAVMPHASPEHYDIWPKMFELFAEELELFLNKRPLLNRMLPCKR